MSCARVYRGGVALDTDVIEQQGAQPVVEAVARPAELRGDALARVVGRGVLQLDLPEVLRTELVDALLALCDEPPVRGGAHT